MTKQSDASICGGIVFTLTTQSLSLRERWHALCVTERAKISRGVSLALSPLCSKGEALLPISPKRGRLELF